MQLLVNWTIDADEDFDVTQTFRVRERDVHHGFDTTELIVCVSVLVGVEGVEEIKNCFIETASKITLRGDTAQRPPQAIKFTHDSWRSGPSLRTTDLALKRLDECIKSIEEQPHSMLRRVAADRSAAMAEFSTIDSRTVPVRPALTDKQSQRRKEKRKALYSAVEIRARWRISFTMPNPIIIFAKDDNWIGDQTTSLFKLVEPLLLNVRNNKDNFARSESFTLRSKRDRLVLKHARSLRMAFAAYCGYLLACSHAP